MEDGVINSAEVEQEAEQENECTLAVCANAIVAQTQVGTAAVTNTATIQDDTTNSAEVEQEAEQENECALQFAPTLSVFRHNRNSCCSQYC